MLKDFFNKDKVNSVKEQIIQKAAESGKNLKDKYDEAKENGAFEKGLEISSDKAKEVFTKASNSQTFSFLKMLETEKKFFMFITFSLVFALSIVSYLLYEANSRSRTIVLPPQVSKEFWVTDKQLSEAYFEQVGFYIADRVLSVSPDTINNIYPSLIPFFGTDSSSNKVIKQQLKDMGEFVIKENLYQIFYPLETRGNYKKKILTVRGSMKKFIGDLLVADKQNNSIDIYYDIEKGKFIIKKLQFNYK